MRVNGVTAKGGSLPSSPQNVVAANLNTGTSAQITWSDPAYSGKTNSIQRYQIQNLPSTSNWQVSNTNTFTFPGLTEGTTYQFFVSAITPYSVISLPAFSNNIVTSQPGFDSIATINVASSTAGSLTFSNIPQTYRSLQVRVICRAAGAPAIISVFMQINGITTTTYTTRSVTGNGSTASTAQNTSASNLFMGNAAPASNNLYGAAVIEIPDYSVARARSFKSVSGCDTNTAGAGTITLLSGYQTSAVAITSLSFFLGNSANWDTGSSLALYGIKG